MYAEQLQRRAGENTTKEAIATPRYSQPSTPPISQAELGLPGLSIQQVPSAMHHIPVQMVPGPSLYQPALQMVAQQNVIGTQSSSWGCECVLQ